MRIALIVTLLLPALAQAQDRHKEVAMDPNTGETTSLVDGTSTSTDREKDASTQVDRSAEKYSRKTLLYFGAKPLGFKMWGLAALGGGNIFTVRWLSEMVGDKVGKATHLKRFDFVHLPWGTRPTTKVLKMFSNYMKAAKMDKAKAEAEYMERYKAFDIKASDLDRVMNSAYFYETELTRARIERIQQRTCTKWSDDGLSKEEKKKRREMRRQGKKVPKRKCLKWKIKWQYKCTLAARTDFYHLIHQNPYKRRFGSVSAGASSTQDKSRNACQSAASSVASKISLKMRRIEEFRLKAPVIDSRKQSTELGFNLGNKEGLRIDQGMYIVEYDQNNRRKKIGYSRVREVGNNEKVRAANSWAQRLTGRGGLGKQVVEDPSFGASFALGGGNVLTFSIAQNLGYAFNAKALSETWFYLSGNAGTDAETGLGVGGIGIGVKKLWYKNRFGMGFKLGAGFAQDEMENPAGSPVDAQGVVEMMMGGWGALQLQGGLTPVGPGGSAGLLFHF